ncbi:MAG TPA: low molecular weight protein-tyrosine-phosphatase [Polyangiaceae bacterium]|jgi:protein-tyrosine phosphatase|nr:low molecular weight protein-tyrosine-phosphatase [Polyangiaceae bacterium]
MNGMVRICFVCMGNICRSPTAEAVMRHLVEERGWTKRFAIESAGTGDWHVGEPADTRSRTAGLERGYSLDRRAQHFTESSFAMFDFVIAADRENRRHLERIAPDDTARSKIHLLRDFDPASPKGSDVPDPYYGGADGFQHVLDVCEAGCRGLLSHVAARWEPK